MADFFFTCLFIIINTYYFSSRQKIEKLNGFDS